MVFLMCNIGKIQYVSQQRIATKRRSIMKKRLALFLACVMVLPLLLSSVATAAEQLGSSSDVGVTPFTLVSWSAIDEKLAQYDNANELYTVNCSVSGDTVKISRPNVGSDPKKIAEDMKKEMEARPESQRYLHVWAPAKAFRMAPEAVIYLDKGVDALKETFTALINECAAIGVPLTGLIVDLEYIGLTSYYITQDLAKDTDLLHDIVSHPLYQTEVRPMLEERGFEFYTGDSYSTEIYGVSTKSGSKYSSCRSIWNRVMRIRLNQYLNESLFEPLLKVYPDATMSDYQSTDSNTWYMGIDGDGYQTYAGGNNIKAGNVSNLNTYSSSPTPNLYENSNGKSYYYNPYSYNKTIYEAKPFNMFLYDNVRFKNMHMATDTNTISAWIAEYDYSSRKGTVCKTPYYTETLYHLGMLDPQPFLLYLYRGAFDNDPEYYEKIDVISEILHELTRVVGASDREPIVLPNNWNNSFVISGMYAGGKNYWRITPDTSTGVTKESFLVQGQEDPTFYINGQTITFPGGKIIEDTAISVVGTCGYWVETETNVVPIISNVADRYAQYPSFQETFENWDEGSLFNFTTFTLADIWVVTDKTQKGTVIVADKNDPDNQILTVTGDITIRNSIMPAQITAGDSYAKRQAWELTFTLPANAVEGAEIVMLNYAGKSQTVKDGGIKVVDGKVYYTKVVEEVVEGTTEENGEPKKKLVAEYQELKDVTLTPGSTYTVKRVLDFTNEEAYFSSFYIYDAAGTLVGSAENVESCLFKTAVQDISFSTKGFGEETVCFDDYKLYPIGYAGDLTLYEAEFGMMLDAETYGEARTGETAYRYSWMNASDKEETVQILAQVLDEEGNVVSETVIKELVTKPGYDGVETGIYDAGDQAVVFVAKILVEEAPKDNMMLYICIAAGAVVLIAVGAAVVILASKKKKPHAPAAE